MRRMSHPNIIRLYDVFESASDLFIVMECCSGGELFDRIKEQGSYSEKDASSVMRQMTQGIRYMHTSNIAHCDLKPDNFLFLSPARDAPIKIIESATNNTTHSTPHAHSALAPTPLLTVRALPCASVTATARLQLRHEQVRAEEEVSIDTTAVSAATTSHIPMLTPDSPLFYIGTSKSYAALRSAAARTSPLTLLRPSPRRDCLTRRMPRALRHMLSDSLAHLCTSPPPHGCSLLCCAQYYVAPEVITGRYSESCDMWSLGVVMFVMLFGYPPFYADQDKYGSETDERIFKLISQGFDPVTKPGYGPHFPQAIPCSESAKDLIAKLLQMDPTKRWSASEALEHPWMTGDTASPLPVLSNVIHNLTQFQANYKFKQAVLTMMSSSLSETEVSELKRTFQLIDENHDGTITQAELKKALQATNSSASDQQSLADIENLIRLADVDGDGKLSYNELLLTCIQKRLAAKEERLWDAFCRLDLNNDGKVSAEELKQVLARNEKDAKDLIKDVDVDGDGMVSYEEFLAMWKAKEEQQQEDGKRATATPMVQ